MLTSLKMMRSTSSGTLAVRSPMRKDAILLQVESIAHMNRGVCVWKVSWYLIEAAHVLAGFLAMSGCAFTHSITTTPNGQ
jgi:hypothetical protein